MEHVVLAERALGKFLPIGAEVHHVNGKRRDNSRGNLVICESVKYHRLLHRRTAALRASGHADWRKCRFCKEHDDPKNLYVNKNNVSHRECFNQYERDRRPEAGGESLRTRDKMRANGKGKCWICKQWDDPDNLSVNGRQVHHRRCYNRYHRD